MLKAKFAAGFFWLSVGTGSQQLISFFVFIYLTQALEPAQFGIVALAAVFIEVLITVSHFGQMEVVQQRADPIDEVASSSFWFVQALGLGSSVALALLAPLIAEAMHQPDLTPYLVALSPAVFITTLGHIHEGLLRRDMSYRPLAIRSVAATAFSGVAALATVLLGHADYALVVQKLAYVTTMTAVLWIAYPWRPKLLISWPLLRDAMRNGLHITSANVSAQFDGRILDFVVGLYLGTYWLGQLKIGWRIFEFVTQISIVPVSNVALRLFAQSSHSPERLKSTFLQTVKVLAFACCPVFFGLAAVAPGVTDLVLGAKWSDATPIIQLLSLLSIAAVINYMFAPLLIAVGRTGHVLAQGLLTNVTTATLAYVSVGFGIYAVVFAHLLRSYLIATANLAAIKRTTAIRPVAIIRMIVPAALSSIAMAILITTVRQTAGDILNPGLELGFQILLGVGAYGIFLMLGDWIGLWRGYLRGLIKHTTDILSSRRQVTSVA